LTLFQVSWLHVCQDTQRLLHHLPCLALLPSDSNHDRPMEAAMLLQTSQLIGPGGDMGLSWTNQTLPWYLCVLSFDIGPGWVSAC
jgi:hypothetical protein